MSHEKQQNQKNPQQNSNGYKAQNSKEVEIRRANVQDSKWITERGGTNDEPAETPSERPHS